MITSNEKLFDNPFAFTGRELDQESGLYYYRARYYDPEARRFLSEDPIGFRGGINFYAYTGGNPIKWRDPKGLFLDFPIANDPIGDGVWNDFRDDLIGGVGGGIKDFGKKVGIGGGAIAITIGTGGAIYYLGPPAAACYGAMGARAGMMMYNNPKITSILNTIADIGMQQIEELPPTPASSWGDIIGIGIGKLPIDSPGYGGDPSINPGYGKER